MLFSEEPLSEFYQTLKKILANEWRHPGYRQACKHADEMGVHVYGDAPTELLNRVRPREEDDIKKYRIESYEPITKSSCNRGISIVNKIFNPTLWSVRSKDEEKSKELLEYLFQYFPVYNSVVAYVREVVVKKMLADPNGIIVVRPQKAPELESERLKPIIKVFGCRSVYNYDFEHYLVLVDRYDKVHTFEYFDKTQWIKFTALHKKDNKNRGGTIIIDIIEQYVYNHEEMPVWHLRGVSEAQDAGEIVYKSYFEPARPFWNLAITHESDVFGAFIQHMHPLRIEPASTCTYKLQGQPCRNGNIRFPDGSDQQCPSCLGSGVRPLASPYGRYAIPKDKLADPSFVPVQYVTVPVEPTVALEARAQKMLDKGLWALSMDVADEVGENQSGTAKVIDRGELYDFLLAISETVFDVHMQNIIYNIAMFMYGVDSKVDDILPELSKPVNFDIASSAEQINNFKVAKDSGLDRNYLTIKHIEILNKDFGANPDLKEVMNAVLGLDPLPGYDPMEINTLVNSGLCTRTDAILHVYLKQIVEEAFREKGKEFFNMSREAQMALLVAKAKVKEKEAKLVLDEKDENAIPGK